jgi:hypothetical protein
MGFFAIDKPAGTEAPGAREDLEKKDVDASWRGGDAAMTWIPMDGITENSPRCLGISIPS